MKRKILCLFSLLVFAVNWSCCITANAEESTTKYYYETITPCGDDDGFVKDGNVDEKDPHYGWKLGKFVISGFTRVDTTNENNPVFLKNVGDTISLNFLLEQDINKINGNEKWFIADDDGYDEYFGIKESNFGKGILITRKTDYQNNVGEPVKYKNYLKGVKKGAETEILLFEEGDYEVSLNYTLRRAASDWNWTQGLLSSDDDYKIFFKFSVRNGNCMSFPREIDTTSELTNKQITSTGFYLDLAKSRYLDIDVTHEVVSQGATGLTTDVRFNRPANDGDQYTDEGIYTITTKNNYTNETTTKIVYVGDDNLLRMLANTGLSIVDVNSKLEEGYSISDDGMLVMTSNKTSSPSNSNTKDPNKSKDGNGKLLLLIIPLMLLIGAIAVIIVIVSKKKANISKE